MLLRQHRRFAGCLAVAGVSFALYLYTLAPTVSYGGDCGELTTCAYTLGVAHPTGYPLYLMVGKLFTALPVGDVAYRMNLMSASFAALTAGVLYWVLLVTSGRLLPAAIGSLAFAGGYGVWSQAVIAEVYTLNVFCIALLVLAAVLWNERRDVRYLYVIGFVLGLSLGAHGMTLLTAPAFTVWFLMNRRGEPILRTVAVAFICGCVGALVLCYLPLRATTNPPINWGNPQTWDSFIAHVTARQFDTLLLGSSIAQLPRRCVTYSYFVFTHFRVLVLFLLAGVPSVALKQPRLFVLCLLILLSNSGLFLTFDQPGAYFQLLPSFLVYGVFVGFACASLQSRLERSFASWRGFGATAVALVAGVLWVSQVGLTFPDVNMRGNCHAVQDVRQVLKEAPNDAVIVSGFDQIWFTLLYYRWVEGVRADAIIEHTGDVGRVMRQCPRRVVCPMFPPTELPKGYYFEPVGTFGYVRSGTPLIRYASPPPAPLNTFPMDGDSSIELLGARTNPVSMRREGMSTLHTYWRLTRVAAENVAALFVFELKGLSTAEGGGGLSSADRAALSQDQFAWTQYHPFTAGGGARNWEPNRVVEDRLPIRPPWRVVQGVYSIRVAIVPCAEDNDVTDDSLPQSRSPSNWVEIGEIEVYMQ